MNVISTNCLQLILYSWCNPPIVDQLLDYNGKSAKIEFNIQPMLAAFSVSFCRICGEVLQGICIKTEPNRP